MDLSAKTIRDLLAELEWFSTLGPKRIGALAARAETLVWEPGETVFEEGDEGDRCYVIHTGQVKAIRSLADGRRVALAQIGAGSVFGELAMFGRKRRSTTIQAVEPTVAVGLESEDVLEALRSDAESSLRVASMLADRLEATNQRVIDQSLASVAGRVAATLLSQLEERLKGGGERRDVELFASPSDIATLAGTSREETVKLLHWLESEELLTVRRGRMIVHDPDALAKSLR